MKQLKIGIVQQHNTADTSDNMRRLAASITSLSQQREIEAVRSGIDKRTRDTENYLENIG